MDLKEAIRIRISDRAFHITLFSIIALLSAVVLYFLSLYTTGDDWYRNKFLSELEIYNPEYTVPQNKETAAKNAPRVPILIYHSIRPHALVETPLIKRYVVDPGVFEKQLQYLKENGYTVIALSYLADALKANINLPPKSVVLTFDDGWENQYRYAFPLLEKYGFTGTFFIFTDAINHRYFLTWDEVKMMDKGGMDIGGHTESHAYLVQVTDQKTLENEITGGKKIIEEHIGRTIDTFAYPFGHYNDQTIAVVKAAGYKTARSTYPGVYNSKDDIFTLKGIEITDDFDKFVKGLNN